MGQPGDKAALEAEEDDEDRRQHHDGGGAGPNGGPNGDYDDLIVRMDVIPTTAPVPLPAAGVLLVGALGGLGLMRRRRSA